jgi:uncharacterized RDD family membrane protein YckC
MKEIEPGLAVKPATQGWAPSRGFVMKEIETGLADWRSRCSAFLLDYILTLLAPALTLVLAVYIKRRWASETAATAVVVIGYLTTAFVIFFNYIHFYMRRGQSFGKRFIGVRVVRIDGRPIDYQTVVLRHIVGYPLSLLFFGLGIVWMLWDRRRQGWHDKLAKTVVIKE